MSKLMAVAFETHGRLHYLDPGDGEYSIGDWVLYPTEDGPELARCVWGPEEVAMDQAEAAPRCLGPASAADRERDTALRRRRAELKVTATELIASHKLPMKVVAADIRDTGQAEDKLAIIYFTAPHRVDFRALIGELARSVSSRVDLRQIGSRDAARLVGGIGSCGRELCCTSFLDDFEPISIKLARTQGLPANPLQIAGACGKLMCCLKFEHPLYVDFKREAPPIGTQVLVAGAPGVVTGHHVPAQAVTVVTEQGPMRCPLETVCTVAKQRRGAKPEGISDETG